jgi:hypothetical protein
MERSSTAHALSVVFDDDVRPHDEVIFDAYVHQLSRPHYSKINMLISYVIFHIAVTALPLYLKRGEFHCCFIELLLSLPLLNNPAPSPIRST